MTGFVPAEEPLDDALFADPPEPTCATCNYAAPSLSDIPDEGPILLCRRNPPQVVVLDGEVVQVWPTMHEGDVCGEHSEFA